MKMFSAKGATPINSLWATPQEKRRSKRLALKARFIAGVNRALSTCGQSHHTPGALPQARGHEFTLSALLA